MGIGTLVPLMTKLLRRILLSEGAPYGFKLVNVEIGIFL
jgi:hypothetical protein